MGKQVIGYDLFDVLVNFYVVSVILFYGSAFMFGSYLGVSGFYSGLQVGLMVVIIFRWFMIVYGIRV